MYIYIFNLTGDIGAVFQWFDAWVVSWCWKTCCNFFIPNRENPVLCTVWKTIVQRTYTTLISANINSRLHRKLKKVNYQT